MSVFCSKTLIFAPECWKCILKGLDFENFLWDMPLESPRNRCKFFSVSSLSKAFATPT